MKLDQIFQSSNLSTSYLFNEILLLEGLEERSLKVHFNIHMSLKDKNVTENDVSQILKSHIISRNSNDSFLAEINIDPRSLLIKGKKAKHCEHYWFQKWPFLSNRIIERFFFIFSKLFVVSI